VQKLLAPREAANILGISYPTLKQWIYHGKIKSVKTPAAPSRAGERDRPPVSEEAGARGHRDAAGKSAEDQRRNQLIGRVVAINSAGCWRRSRGDRRAAYYLDHHGGCGEGIAAEARGPGRGADQINRSNDPEGVTSTTSDW